MKAVSHLTVKSIHVSKRLALILSKDGMVYSWGEDLTRQGLLGTGTKTTELLKPCPVGGLIDFTILKLALSDRMAVALDSKGRVFTWGCGKSEPTLLKEIKGV